jgi:hypothetical protein
MNKKQLVAQITELGTATELTLGFSGKVVEGKRGRAGDLWQSEIKTEQVTELGAATELTLGSGGSIPEGRGRYIKSISC